MRESLGPTSKERGSVRWLSGGRHLQHKTENLSLIPGSHGRKGTPHNCPLVSICPPRYTFPGTNTVHKTYNNKNKNALKKENICKPWILYLNLERWLGWRDEKELQQLNKNKNTLIERGGKFSTDTEKGCEWLLISEDIKQSVTWGNENFNHNMALLLTCPWYNQ